MGIRTFPDNPTLFGGTGKDGAYAPASSENFTDAEGEWVIKEYSSITIGSGVTVSADNRIKGLILYCTGNVTIDGVIDLDGKGYGSEQAPPIVYDRYYSSGVLKSAWAEYCSSVCGGDGGGGGGGGETTQYDGGHGGYAGGAGYIKEGTTNSNGGNASGWTPGVNSAIYGSGPSYAWTVAPSFGRAVSGFQAGSDHEVAGGGGSGYIGVINAGGNSGAGGSGLGAGDGAPIVKSSGANATLTTGSKYGGALLVIIAKGSITVGATGNIHSDGEDASDISSYDGAAGGGGGGCVVLMSQGTLTQGGTITVAGGLGGVHGGTGGGDGGDGENGSTVTQQVA